MAEYIPLEIQEEILKRLPVKPLAQFRSVSKPWKCLIDSPDFVAAYGVRLPHPDRFILRYKDSSDGREGYLTFVDNDNDHSFIRQDFVPTLPNLIKTLYCSRVVGSSHGLLCFYCLLTKMVVVWNPSTRKSIGIEVPYMHGYAPLRVEHVFSFGVCPVTFDPTIVKIEYGFGLPWKVGVFTLSTGAWSILSTNLPRELVRLSDGDQITIDGFIYWLAFDKLGPGFGQSSRNHLIVSFDLTTKEIKEINLPDSLTNPLCRIQTISKLRESLVVLAYHKEFEEDVSFSSCCLWKMKEQGVNRSFTKLYNINMPYSKINKILGFRKTGELIILRQQQNAEIQIYDPNSEAIHNLRIGRDGYDFFMCSYMETLLLLDQLDGFIYFISN